MRYLRKFASHNDYLEAFASIDNEEDRLRFKKTVCMFEDDCGKESDDKQTVIKYSIRSSDAWVGDLLAWDTQENKWAVINRNDIGTLNADNSSCECGFDKDRYIPDAICVIPASHMENGKARWCALRDCYDEKYSTDPDNYYNECNTFTDVSHSCYYWSENNVDVTTLNNYIAYPLVASDNDIGSNYQSNISGSFVCDNAALLYILSEKGDINILNFLCVQFKEYSKLNPRTYKDIDGSAISIDIFKKSKNICPWLYNDGTYEEGNSYGIKKYKDAFTPYCNDKHLNVLSDLDGYENTKKIIEYCEANNAMCEAAYAAYTYKQNELSNGQWYLPASGELAYLLSRWYTIQLSLYKLYLIVDKPSTWSQTIVPLICDFGYWSSTLSDADFVVNINSRTGILCGSYKYCDVYFVRSFRSY